MAFNSRLSVSAMLTFQQNLEQDLTFWQSLGVKQVGLFYPKIREFGQAEAIRRMKAQELDASCVIWGRFDLTHPENWEVDRAMLADSIAIASAMGGCVYGTTGRGRFGEWDDNVRAFAEAIAPCIEAGRRSGVRLAFEPSLRPQISFAHTLTDARDIADKTGIGLVVDVGNCWMERDIERVIRDLGSHIALVQLSDFAIGTFERPGERDKVLPGMGELPLHRFIEAALAAGYDGPFEVELLVPPSVDHSAIARSIALTSQILDEVLGVTSGG